MNNRPISLCVVLAFALVATRCFGAGCDARSFSIECSGSGGKELYTAQGAWQTNNYNCTVAFTLSCRLIQETSDALIYSIVAAKGTARLWGNAEHHLGGVHDYLNYDRTCQLDIPLSEGRLTFSKVEGRVVSAGFPLCPTSGTADVRIYYLEYFASSQPYSVRLHALFRSPYLFDDAYDTCPARRAVFRNPIMLQGLDIAYTDGFEYDSVYTADPHWRFAALGAGAQAQFTLSTVPASAKLRLGHLSAAAAGCPGGGYSPVDIYINDHLLEDCYDPAEHHGGVHSFVTDEWEIAPYLQSGLNLVTLCICDSACSYYWISDLAVRVGSSNCPDCQGVFVDPTPNDIDLLESMNRAAHHTTPYRTQDKLVVRRGQPFAVEWHLPTGLAPDALVISFQAYDINASRTIPIPYGTSAGTANEPWAQRIKVYPDAQGRSTLKVRINLPANEAVGEYSLKVLYRVPSSPNPPCELVFSANVVVLFNPWCSADAVFFPNAWGRNEYILNEAALLYTSSSKVFSPLQKNVVPWQLDQFTETALALLLDLLAPLTPAQRADPALVSAYLCAKANANDGDGGILIGKWQEPYTGGIRPENWQRTSELYRAFWPARTPVKYGKCWVFSGLLTSLLRSAGIPARPISAFNVGRDFNDDGNLDVFYEIINGRPELTGGLNGVYCSDSVWNFHAWCDAWMRRPDVPNSDGWQALDASPQLPPSTVCIVKEVNQVGPASLAAIRGHRTSEAYQVKYVHSEVAAPHALYLCVPNGGCAASRQPPPLKIADYIITKAIGFPWECEITSEYKNPTALAALAAPADLPLQVALDAPDVVAVGNDFVFYGQVTNRSATPRLCRIVLGGGFMGYDGSEITNVWASVDVTNLLAPGAGLIVPLPITQAEYFGGLKSANTVEGRLVVVDLGANEPYIVPRRTQLLAVPAHFSVTPSNHIDLSQSLALSFSWTNTLAVTLTNVTIVLNTTRGLSVGGTNVVQVVVGDIASGQVVLFTTNLVAQGIGNQMLTLQIDSDQLNPIFSYCQVSVGSSPSLNIRVLDGIPQVTLPTAPDEVYMLEAAETVDQVLWDCVSDVITGTGAPYVWVDAPTGLVPQRFYRVRLIGP